MILADDILLVDPGRSEPLSYQSLWSSMMGPNVKWTSVVRPSNSRDAVRALARAVILRKPITVDSDWSSDKLSAMGIDPSRLDIEEIIPGICAADWSEALQKARSSPGFQLTLYTSGTGGIPKPVTHSLDGITRMLKVSKAHSNDVWALAYSPFHIAGVQVVMQALFNGNQLYNVFGVGRDQVIETINKYGVTHFSATPSFYRLLIPFGISNTKIRSITLGGECSDARLIGKLHRAFPRARFHNIYASTELGAILVAEGEVFSIEQGQESQVCVKEGRLHVHRNLLGIMPSADTSAAWYDTGDCVELIGEAPLRFRISARKSDFVNVGGYRVNPQEVERVVRNYPGISNVRVNGRANSVTGQMLCAEIVSDGPFPDEVELRQFMAKHLPAHKIPRLIRLVQTLSHTSTGKLSRR